MANLKPPPTFAGSRVLEFAVLDQSVRYSGHSNLFVDNKEIGAVPRLAICQIPDGQGVYLFHCDEDWQILGMERCDSLPAARISAEHTYIGVSRLWIDAAVTEEEAIQHLQQVWGPQRCIFCQKAPPETPNRRFIEKNGSFVCETCIDECHQLLHG